MRLKQGWAIFWSAGRLKFFLDNVEDRELKMIIYRKHMLIMLENPLRGLDLARGPFFAHSWLKA